MADPLSLLREHHINNKQIVERRNQIVLGSYAFPKTIKTNFQITTGAEVINEINEKEYYTLECVLFFLRHSHIPHLDYIREAAAAKVPFVRRPDRTQLLAYLNGQIDTCPSIDPEAINLFTFTWFRMRSST